MSRIGKPLTTVVSTPQPQRIVTPVPAPEKKEAPSEKEKVEAMLAANRRHGGPPVFSMKTILCTALDIDEQTYNEEMQKLGKESERWLRRLLLRRTGKSYNNGGGPG